MVSLTVTEVQALKNVSASFEAEQAAGGRRRCAILDERIVNLGRRGALERTAHLFCELAVRLGDDEPLLKCNLPMTQTDLAELLGLSVVHTNRMVQTLRRKSLAEVGRGRLRIQDFDALAELGGFSSDYLR